jgi:hypothetical protein
MRFFTILLLALATSCAPVYLPNTRNTPLFRGAGEFQGSAWVGSGLNGHLAYSMSDHVAVLGNVSFASTPENRQSGGQQFDFTKSHLFYEAGLGVFGRNRAARYELFAGYGMGQGNSLANYRFFGTAAVVADGKYTRLFVQPSIGTNNRKFNLAFTPRISLVDFSEFKTDTRVHIPTESPQLFVESALTAKFLIKGNLHGMFQAGLNVPVPSEVFFEYPNFQFAFGIQVHTGGLRTRLY